MIGWTRLRQLAKTSAIRLALRYAAMQVALLALALAALFWATNRYVEQQIATSLETELGALTSLPAPALAARVSALSEARSRQRGARHYLLLDARGMRLAGDIARWPRWLVADNRPARGPITVLAADDATEDPPDALDTPQLPAIAARLADGNRLLIAQEPGDAEDLREYALLAALMVLGLAASMSIVLGLALGWQWLSRIDAINRTWAGSPQVICRNGSHRADAAMNSTCWPVTSTPCSRASNRRSPACAKCQTTLPTTCAVHCRGSRRGSK